MLAGIGGGAVAVIALIIILIATHAGQTTAQNKVSAHPTATTIPTPSATPVETLTYQNALDSSSSRWPRSSHAFFASNGYEISGAWISYAPVRAIGDGTISVRMRQIGGPSDQFYGILFRGASANQYYFYGIAQNQQWTFSIIQNGNGVPIVAPTTDAHINAGLNANNTITVRTRGSHFVFYVNGVQVGQATDSRISSGQTGLINATGALQVVYNDFTVTTPAP